ncbi:hypothetical protein F4678DRAFT_436939 [Xylaria arbuscula]|nr:hypothetical protein F4678DRAFT_436939 [Xylaria arbuscula]
MPCRAVSFRPVPPIQFRCRAVCCRWRTTQDIVRVAIPAHLDPGPWVWVVVVVVVSVTVAHDMLPTVQRPAQHTNGSHPLGENAARHFAVTNSNSERKPPGGSHIYILRWLELYTIIFFLFLFTTFILLCVFDLARVCALTSGQTSRGKGVRYKSFAVSWPV